MNQFDSLIARNLTTDFNDWHNAIRAYHDVDGAHVALYEAALRSPSFNVSLAYGALTRLLANFFDAMQGHYAYDANGEKSLAGYVFRTFSLLSAMNNAHSDMELTSTFPVRKDIIEFLDKFLLSHS